MNFKPKELEFYAYEKMLENGWLKAVYENYKTLQNQIIDTPNYGELSEQEIEDNHQIYKLIENQRMKIVEIIKEIKKDLRKNNCKWSWLKFMFW